MSANMAKRMLRRVNEDYTPSEVVAQFFSICTDGGWPETSLAELLCEFDSDEKGKIKSTAIFLLNTMKPEWTGFQHGYITTEEGDYERMMASPVITKQFIEALVSDL